MRQFLFLSAAVLLFASPSFAEVQITSRTSLVSATVDFGYVGSVTTTTDSFAYTSIDDTQLLRQGSGSDGGPIGDVSWDATYQYSLDQQLVPDANQLGLSGAGSTSLFTFVGGEGVSFISSTNHLEVAFTNTASTVFDLSLLATPFSRVDLEYATSPGVWEPVLSNPGGFDEVADQLTLAPGDYRVLAGTVVATDNGFSTGGSWSFTITPVPEPSTVTLLALSAAGLLVMRRKS